MRHFTIAIVAAASLMAVAACDTPTDTNGRLAPTDLSADITAVTPSTNDINRANGWAHFNVLDNVGAVTVEFVSTRNFYSCFEHRSDGEAPDYSRANYNTDVTDGLWDFVCVNGRTQTLTIAADGLVEIRMVFGAESDERFDWTPVEVVNPATKADCKDGGWADFGFRNQGQCIRFVNTGKDSR